MPTTTAAELASIIGGNVNGDGTIILRGISAIDSAEPVHVSFLTKSHYIESAKKSRAGCIIAKSAELFPNRTVIVVPNPHLGYVKAMHYFHPEPEIKFEVSPQALVGKNVKLPQNIRIEMGAIISTGCEIGEKSAILSGAVLREECKIGVGCIIHSGVILYPGTQLGDRVIVHANAVLGNDGFGYYLGDTTPLKVPHVGRVVVEDDVEIGACTCIERATFDETRIGARTKIGDLVNIGHNVKIGPDTVIINQSLISGSVNIGSACRILGQVAIRGHLTIGDGALILAGSLVTRSVPKNGKVGGRPAMPHMQWKRVVACLNKLPKIMQNIDIDHGKKQDGIK